MDGCSCFFPDFWREDFCLGGAIFGMMEDFFAGLDFVNTFSI